MATWRNRQRSWRRNNRKSAFGGTVKTVEQVEALSQQIKDQEAAEFAEFEKNFDADLRAL